VFKWVDSESKGKLQKEKTKLIKRERKDNKLQKEQLKSEPVIVHYQASRRFKNIIK
jgi:DNA/RNA-binding domain of Phe-tRNA-synthetase-like protein